MRSGEASAVDHAVDRLVHTRFGSFPVDPGAVIHFPAGLPGFEQCRQFVVLSSPELAPFSCLHAVEGPPASFLVIDRRLVLSDYRCALGINDLKDLLRSGPLHGGQQHDPIARNIVSSIS